MWFWDPVGTRWRQCATRRRAVNWCRPVRTRCCGCGAWLSSGWKPPSGPNRARASAAAGPFSGTCAPCLTSGSSACDSTIAVCAVAPFATTARPTAVSCPCTASSIRCASAPNATGRSPTTSQFCTLLFNQRQKMLVVRLRLNMASL